MPSHNYSSDSRELRCSGGWYRRWQCFAYRRYISHRRKRWLAGWTGKLKSVYICIYVNNAKVFPVVPMHKEGWVNKIYCACELRQFDSSLCSLWHKHKIILHKKRKIKPNMNHYDPVPATAKNSEYGARSAFFFVLPLTHDRHWFCSWTEEKLIKQYKKIGYRYCNWCLTYQFYMIINLRVEITSSFVV